MTRRVPNGGRTVTFHSTHDGVSVEYLDSRRWGYQAGDVAVVILRELVMPWTQAAPLVTAATVDREWREQVREGIGDTIAARLNLPVDVDIELRGGGYVVILHHYADLAIVVAALNITLPPHPAGTIPGTDT